MGIKIALLLIVFTLLPLYGAQAAEPGAAQAEAGKEKRDPKNASGLPVPRFVSLSGDKVFIRTGPALKYPIKWVYQHPHMPVEIISEFDTWRKVRDIDGDDGWVHQSLLSGHRSGIVKGEGNLPIRKEPSSASQQIAAVEPSSVVNVEACTGAWCEIEAQGYDGFAERKFLWGIYPNEDFD